MKLRITQIRATADRPPTSDLSRNAQKMVAVVDPKSPSRGADPSADLAQDKALLDAYNRQLVAKKCRPLDIDGELQGRPTPPAAKAGAGKPAAAKAVPLAKS